MSEIIAAGDTLIYEYYATGSETLWFIVKNQLPILKEEVENILNKLDQT